MTHSQLKKNYSLKTYNTFAIDACAELFCEVHHPDDFLELLPTLRDHHLPILVLGGGSNILLTQNFPGIVIKTSNRGIAVTDETMHTIDIQANAGENWHDLVTYCVERNYGGIENLSLIPGQVGAAPIQNIGAYGVELKDVFVSLSAIHLQSGKTHQFVAKACQFSYRNSVFKQALKNQYCITDVTLRLKKKPKINLDYHGLKETLLQMQVDNPSIKDVSQAVIKIRQQKLPDPKIIGNAGSFFKNPIISQEKLDDLQEQFSQLPSFSVNKTEHKLSAAWLIEQCGFKGKRFADIGVHQNQALVLINYGNGDGKQIAHLAEQIQQRVFKKFKVMLETEVNII